MRSTIELPWGQAKMQASTHRTVQPLLRRALVQSKMLSPERERDLLVRFHATEDKAAMDELVRSHMPIIFRAASRNAQNPGIDINDLVQTATEGLLIAINRWSFDKSDGNGLRPAETDAESAAPDAKSASRLATYALWWMRTLLTDNVIEARGVIVRAKGPKTRKALFSLSAAIRKLDISLPLNGGDVTRIACYLGIGEREIEEALVHAAGDVMLDEPVGDGSVLRGEVFADERAEGEDMILARLVAANRWNSVCEALMALPPRSRFVLTARYLLTPKWKLDRLSATLRMSRERVRQIGDDAIWTIRRRLASSCVADAPARGAAAPAIAALVDAIEIAAASPDPEVLMRLLCESNVSIGPLRLSKRRMPQVACAA